MRKIQEKVKKFCVENNMESPLEHQVLDTMSELGEVAKEILKMSDYGRRTPEYRGELKSELGDVLYSLITIANTFNIDLEDALNQALEKYKERLKSSFASSDDDCRACL